MMEFTNGSRAGAAVTLLAAVLGDAFGADHAPDSPPHVLEGANRGLLTCEEVGCFRVADQSNATIVAVDALGSYPVELDCDLGVTETLLDDDVGTCCSWNLTDVSDIMMGISLTNSESWELGRVRGTWGFSTGDGPNQVQADMYDAQTDMETPVATTLSAVQFISSPDFVDGVTWLGTELRLQIRSTVNDPWDLCDLSVLFKDEDVFANGFE